MNIVINASNLKVGGAIQVATSVINEIEENEDNYTVLLSPIFKGIHFENKSNVTFYYVEYPSRFNLLGRVSKLDRIVDETKAEVVFTVFGPSYWKPKVRHVCGFAQGYYIYKHLPFFSNQKLSFNWKLFFLCQYHKFLLKKQVDEYFVETEDVKNKLANFLGEERSRIHVASNTYSSFFECYETATSVEEKSSSTISLLTIASPYPHKNLLIYKNVAEYLMRYSDLDFKFFITVPDKYYVENFKGYENAIINYGVVKNSECPRLYEKADFMILPSLVECFSASYPEAMFMEKPILTSDYSFSHSICGDAAIYFDPLDVKDIAEKIILLACDHDMQQQLVRKGVERLSRFDSPSMRFSKYINKCKKVD